MAWISCYTKYGNDNNHLEVSVVSDYYRHLRTESMSKGDQMQRDVYAWLSPPDASTNHNIACEVYHNGTAQWFIKGSTFGEWKTSGSLLWIHGMRSFFVIMCL
jgi:hypothetical protein